MHDYVSNVFISLYKLFEGPLTSKDYMYLTNPPNEDNLLIPYFSLSI